MRLPPAGLAVCFGVVLLSSAAHARCTTADDARQVLAALRRTMECRFRELLSGPGHLCEVEPPPACAGTLVSDVAALAYGPERPAAAVDRRALRQQLRCQRRIGMASARFVGLTLRYRIRGHARARAEARARALLEALPERCGVEAAASRGVVLPALGPQLAAAAAGAGSPVDASALRDGLAMLLGTWADRVGPAPEAPRRTSC